MTLGVIIGCISVALLLLAFALCVIAKREDEHIEIIERRLRDLEADRLEPDFPGEILPFERRAS